VVVRLLEYGRDFEEGIEGDQWSVPEAKIQRRLLRHPRGNRQASRGELDAERASRLLVDEDRMKPLPGQRVERVPDRDDLITGIVSEAALGSLSPRAFGRSRPSAKPRPGIASVESGPVVLTPSGRFAA
jgi:hypothetical protein